VTSELYKPAQLTPMAFKKSTYDAFMDGQIKSADIKRVRKTLGLTVTSFSHLLGTNPITIYRWEQEVPKHFKSQHLVKIRNLLVDLVKDGSLELK
jgi:DNA-binding transcriptional regulator YiaG